MTAVLPVVLMVLTTILPVVQPLPDAARVLDVCTSGDGGAWLATACPQDDFNEAVLLHRIDAEGAAVFVDTLGIVRGDAVSCILTSMEDDGCAAAVETGTGYTGIVLRSYDSDLVMEWELGEDGPCYDSPFELLELSEGGLLLLWDSWSEDRGLWTMRVSPEGEAVWKTFVMPTANPFYSCMCLVPDGGCAVSASTVVLFEENTVVQLDGNGTVTNGWSTAALEPLGAYSVMGLWNSGSGLLSAWSTEPVPGSLDTLLIVELHAGGEQGSSWGFELDRLSGSDLVYALPEGGFVLCGSVSGQAWIAVTDQAGTVEWDHIFDEDFTIAAMDITPDGHATLAGNREPDSGSGPWVVCVELMGEECWILR